MNINSTGIAPEAYFEFFKLSFEPMCVIDVDGHLLAVNHAFSKLLGISSNHNLSKLSMLDSVCSDDLTLIKSNLENVRSGSRSQSIAVRLEDATGNHKWFLLKMQLSQNQLIYVVAKDITPFQQLESAEQAKSQFAEALLDSVLAINDSNLTLESVFQRILSNIGKVVPFNYVDIMLLHGNTASIEAMQSVSETIVQTEQLSIQKFDLDKYVYLGAMAKHKHPVMVHDVTNDENWKVVPGLEFGGSYLGSPVVFDDEVIAFINVIKFQTHFYNSIHSRQLLMFANHVAIAIKNAYLYEQAEDAATLKERQRLARELHDSVNQILFSAGTYAKLIPKVMDSKPEKVKEYASKISQRIRGALAQMRTILVELRPESLTNTDLNVLLKQLCDAFTGNTGIEVNMLLSNNVLLYQEAQIAYYRIAQEALHNIEKHANATEVNIGLFENNDGIKLVIEDNGDGFTIDAVDSSHFGVQNMRDRATSIGALLKIESETGEGTRLILEGKRNGKH